MLVTLLCISVIAVQVNGISGNGTPSILIVGGGPSGIAAATKLLKNNFTNIKILEAENRIGGRINSIKFGDSYVDLGAQFCHGEENNIVYSLVKDLNVLKRSELDISLLYSGGEVIDNVLSEKLCELADPSFDEILNDECGNATSVGECIDDKIDVLKINARNPAEAEIIQQSSDWLQSSIGTMDGVFSLYDLSLNSHYEVCKGHQQLNWNGQGYKTIFDVMMEKYPNKENKLPIDDKIFLNKEVSNITNWNKSDGKTIVSTSDGSVFEADHVIFTPSLGYLKANYRNFFYPSLDQEKIDAIKNMGFGAILKIIMHFPEKWWGDEKAWGFIWSAKDKEVLREKNLEWLLNESAIVQAENNPNVLIGWCSGKHVPHIETLSEEEILQGQEYLLTKFLGSKHNISLPDKTIRTTWYSNPHFLGTYSYESLKSENAPEKIGSPLFNEDQIPTVLFAGEATHPHHYSTVHGAIETGYREADRLIKIYSK